MKEFNNENSAFFFPNTASLIYDCGYFSTDVNSETIKKATDIFLELVKENDDELRIKNDFIEKFSEYSETISLTKEELKKITSELQIIDKEHSDWLDESFTGIDFMSHLEKQRLFLTKKKIL